MLLEQGEQSQKAAPSQTEGEEHASLHPLKPLRTIAQPSCQSVRYRASQDKWNYLSFTGLVKQERM